MRYDLVPIQATVLVPVQPSVATLEFSVDLPDDVYAEFCSARDAFQATQQKLAEALKAAHDARRPSNLVL